MKYLSSYNKQSLFNQLAFYALLGSGAFIMLLWPPCILGKYLSSYIKNIIFLSPWLLLCLSYSWQVVANREHRLEIILIVSIIIIAVINVFLSDSPVKSLSFMRTFLFSGLFALWAAMLLLTDQWRRNGFDWLCCGALAVILPLEFITWWGQGKYGPMVFQIFALHPIPLGTMVILLSPGPMRLLLSKNFQARLLGGLLALSGVIMILLTHKRGTWLALAAMLAVGMIYLGRRHRYLLVTMLLVLAVILSWQIRRHFARLDPNIPRYVSILHRLELYNYALHIWKTHPIMGIGLRSFSHDRYLHDYQVYNEDLHDFPKAVATLHTLDNMLLTAMVELGSLLALLYLALILVIVVRYGRKLWAAPETPTLEWYRMLVLLGFAIHSLSYDSLLVVPVNWVFHVQLGLMAGSYAAEKGRG
jgi:O-antigen ligase